MTFVSWARVAWSYVSRYAWVFFAVLSAGLAYALFKRPDVGDLAGQLEEIRKRHEEEIARIREADAELLRRREEDQRKLEEALALLDESYRQQLSELDDAKRKEVDDIVRQHGDDPRALADLLAKSLDLTVR